MFSSLTSRFDVLTLLTSNPNIVTPTVVIMGSNFCCLERYSTAKMRFSAYLAQPPTHPNSNLNKAQLEISACFRTVSAT